MLYEKLWNRRYIYIIVGILMYYTSSVQKVATEQCFSILDDSRDQLSRMSDDSHHCPDGQCLHGRRKKCLEAGMNAHLPKPMDVEKLCGMIERLRK